MTTPTKPISIFVEQDNNDLDTLLDQLKKTQTVKDMIRKEEDASTPMTEEEISAFVLKYSATIIKKSTEAFSDLKDAVVAGGNPEDVSSMAELINATTTAISEMNKIALQNKKLKASKEIAQMQIEAKKEVPQFQQNNFFLANREEMMKQLFDKVSTKELPSKEIDI